MSNRIQFRRDTAARWAEVNPILMEGEIGIETDSKPYKIKVGDGVNTWNQLGYSWGVGNIVNNPDDEDIVSENNMLKFADKAYDTDNFSGLGHKYLRKNLVTGADGTTKNVLTQDMVSAENTIYIIQYDYDLNSETITVPNGCTLQFEGGSLANGKLSGYININASEDYVIFYNISSSNIDLRNAVVYSQWFGQHKDVDNCQDFIHSALDFAGRVKVMLPSYSIKINSSIILRQGSYLAQPNNLLYSNFITCYIEPIVSDIDCIQIGNEDLSKSYIKYRLDDIAIECPSTSNAYRTCIGVAFRHTEMGMLNGLYVSGCKEGMAFIYHVNIAQNDNIHIEDCEYGIHIYEGDGGTGSNFLNAIYLRPRLISTNCDNPILIEGGIITTIEGGACEIGGYSQQLSCFINVKNNAEVNLIGCLWGEGNYTEGWGVFEGNSRTHLLGDNHILTQAVIKDYAVVTADKYNHALLFENYFKVGVNLKNYIISAIDYSYIISENTTFGFPYDYITNKKCPDVHMRFNENSSNNSYCVSCPILMTDITPSYEADDKLFFFSTMYIENYEWKFYLNDSDFFVITFRNASSTTNTLLISAGFYMDGELKNKNYFTISKITEDMFNSSNDYYNGMLIGFYIDLSLAEFIIYIGENIYKYNLSLIDNYKTGLTFKYKYYQSTQTVQDTDYLIRNGFYYILLRTDVIIPRYVLKKLMSDYKKLFNIDGKRYDYNFLPKREKGVIIETNRGYCKCYKTSIDSINTKNECILSSYYMLNINVSKFKTRPELSADDSGFQCFDTTLNKPIWWTGSVWVDATGTEVS